MTERQPSSTSLAVYDDSLGKMLDELSLALKWQASYLAMAVSVSDFVREDSRAGIENFALDHGHHVVQIHLDEIEGSNVGYWLDKLGLSDHSVFFVDGFDRINNPIDVLRVLDHYYYLFIQRNIRIVFWFSYEDLRLAILHAPVFVSRRNLLVELENEPSSEVVLQKALEFTWQGVGDYTVRYDEMDKKISYRESVLVNLPDGSESTSMRANLLLSLGLLNWRRGNYQKAEELLEDAMEIAAHLQNNWFEAECYNALALLKSSLGRNDEAIDAYKHAIKLAPNEIFAWNNLGNLCLKINRNDEAMIAFQKAVEHNPEDAVAWNGLGDVYYRSGYIDDAIGAYRNSIKYSPILHHPWNGLGNIYASTGRFDDAEKAFRKTIQLNRNFIAAWISLAHLYEKGDRFRDAIRVYQQALSVNPRNASIWNDFGNTCLKLGKADDAVTAFTKAIDLNRGFGWAYSNLGIAYAQRGEVRESISFHQRSIDLLSDDSEKAIVWNRLAEVYRILDEYDNAVHAYRVADSLNNKPDFGKPGPVDIAIDVEPGEKRAMGGESTLREDRGDDRSEILMENENYSQDSSSNKNTGGESMGITMPLLSRIFGGKTTAAENDPSHVSTGFEIASDWNEKGNDLFRKGAYEDAEAAFERAIRQDKSFGWAYSNLGLTHLMQERYGEAMILFQKSIELLSEKKDQSVVWNHLGNLYRLLNDYENAVVAYQTADDLDSDSVGIGDGVDDVYSAPGSTTGLAWDELGDQFFEMSAFGEAGKCYEKAIEIEPANGFFYSNRALCLTYMGNYQEAIPLYEKSISLLKENNEKALVWNRLGNIYRKLDEYDKAMEAYQNAVKLNGDQADLVTRARFSLLSNCYVE